MDITPPNVATFGVPLDITKCGYFCTPPNVAYFGVPKEMSKSGNFALANLQFSLLLSVLATSVLHQMWPYLEHPWKCPIF